MASNVIIKEMYGGEYTVVHNPFARGSQPRYLVNNTERPKGVTTILGQTLSKDLMQWSVDCMKEYLKDKLPAVTMEDLEEGALEYTRRRDAGASAGTEAHALVESLLKGEMVDIGGASKEALNAFNAFVDWFSSHDVEVLGVEEVVYSPTHEYAGTYDALLRVNGQVYLCDLKTTNVSRKAPNGVYAEYFAQLGAYAGAHNEQREVDTELLPIDGLMVISAKKTGRLDIVTNDDVELTVEQCSELFKLIRTVHRFLIETTKRLGGK